MRHPRIISLLILLPALLMTAGGSASLLAAEQTPAAKTQKKGGSQKKQPAPAQKKTKGGTKGDKTTRPAAKKGAKKKNPPRETSAAVQRQHQSVTKEITQTQKKIEANDVAVSTNLATLQGLEHDVKVQQQKVTDLHTRSQHLETTIAGCEEAIARSEQRLEAMRRQYVLAIKKMRVARKHTNPLAFVFSSKNFYQALRRMRYLRTFADWRRRREGEIKAEIERLDKQRKYLAANKSTLQHTLVDQEEASRVLVAKQQEQAATVSKLRADGQALRAHLARKQAEANALNSRVAQLIAAEQAEAAAAEKRRQEQAARAAAEKAERERKAAEKAEAERLAAERRKQAEAEQAARAAKEQAARKPEKGQAKAAAPAKEQAARKPEQPQASPAKKEEKRYADARRRAPRKQDTPTTASAPKPAPKATTPAPRTDTKPAAPAKTAAGASGFAAAKGSLPRPVVGQFNIVSRFGRHPLPDLPEVMYDNPGIDAVVAKGAAAQAVYAGTVTGIYALPGYSTVVIVSHGDYYTVYGNIGKPLVKKGDSVKAGQQLGRLVADASEGGRTTIHFEVWKNREKQNPEAWIK